MRGSASPTSPTPHRPLSPPGKTRGCEGCPTPGFFPTQSGDMLPKNKPGSATHFRSHWDLPSSVPCISPSPMASPSQASPSPLPGPLIPGKASCPPTQGQHLHLFSEPPKLFSRRKGGWGVSGKGFYPPPAPPASLGVPRSMLGSRPQPLRMQLGSCWHRPLCLVFGPPCLRGGQGGGGTPKDKDKQGVAKKRRRPVPGLPALPYMAAAAQGQEVTTTTVSARQRWRFGGPRLAWPLGGKIGGGLWSLFDPLAGKCHPAPAPTSPHPSQGDGCAGG